jgi:hypothetical protein
MNKTRKIGIVSILFLCLFVPACANLGPTGGHRAGFTAGTITSLSPSSVMAGGPPLTLTVNGSNLNFGVVTLVWNGTTNIQAAQGSNDTQAIFVINPSLIANPGTVSIQLIDSVPGDRPSNTVTYAITPRGTTACSLFGAYNFLFTAGNGGEIAGAFGVNESGNVSGEEDFVTGGTNSSGAFTGKCTNSTTSGEGTLTFTIPSIPSSSYSFVLQNSAGGSPRGQLFGKAAIDSSGRQLTGSGVFVGTATNSVLKDGDYSFGLVGQDPYGGGGVGSQIGVIGRFTYSNGTLSAGVGDINDGGTLIQSASVSGTNAFQPPDVWPRIMLNLKISGLRINVAVYTSSSESAFTVGFIDTPITHSSGLGIANVAGFITPQANAGSYSNTSLNSPVVFSTWGSPPPCCPAINPSPTDTTIGLVSGFNSGAGTFNLLFDNVSGGTANLNQAITGATYNVASNGRTAVSYTSGGQTHNYVYYLDNANDGYILGLDSNAEFGFFQPQAPGPFNAASINGTFAAGTFLPETPGSPNLVTEVTLNNGDFSANTPSGALSGTYSVGASGRGTATVNLPVLGGNDLVFYVISPNSVALMGSDNTMSDAITFMHF